MAVEVENQSGSDRNTVGVEARLNVVSNNTSPSADLSSPSETLSHNHDVQMRRLNNLFQALPGAVVMLDGEGRVVQSNPAAVELLGEPLSETLWRDVVSRSFSPKWDDGHDISLVNGRVVNISTQPMIDEPGQILLIKDVTETRHLQEQLNQAKRLSAKGEMAAALAHQIRTPLASAILYLSNLTQNKLDEKVRDKFLNKSLARLNSLERLIEDMLLFSRGENFVMQSFSLVKLFELLQQQIEPLLQSEQVNFVIDPNIQDCTLSLNSEAMISVLSNLVENAIQASDEAVCQIFLTARIQLINQENVVRISLADNGRGIPESIRETIFEPFVTARANGTGLGLSVAKTVIRSHGGGISVRDAEPKGTIFEITLPTVRYMK